LVIADALVEKFGGDSLGEIIRNRDSYLASIPDTIKPASS
jgi:chorismate synthase